MRSSPTYSSPTFICQRQEPGDGSAMLLLSGVFFPVDQMPEPLRAIAFALPLSHAIDIARPLLAGRIPDDLMLHLVVLLGYACLAYYVALVLTRRRLLK